MELEKSSPRTLPKPPNSKYLSISREQRLPNERKIEHNIKEIKNEN